MKAAATAYSSIVPVTILFALPIIGGLVFVSLATLVLSRLPMPISKGPNIDDGSAARRP